MMLNELYKQADYKDSHGMLFHGDCLEIMKNIEDESIDMILADPPYGTTACKWDSVIPFEPMWEQLNRIIKPNGAICIFGSEPFSSALRMSNIKHFKYDWIWEKTRATDFVNANNKPLKRHEIISVFSNGTTANGSNKKMVYFPQGLVRSERKIKRTSRGFQGERPNQKNEYTSFWTNYPSSVLKYKSIGNTIHPTQKPVDLLEYLIRTYTNEGETVLDFTMGSGSTCVAAKNLGRKYIGIELDEQYFDVAKGRLANA